MIVTDFSVWLHENRGVIMLQYLPLCWTWLSPRYHAVIAGDERQALSKWPQDRNFMHSACGGLLVSEVMITTYYTRSSRVLSPR